VQELAGKVAVVTGAASGIGRALAERFASEGMKVVLADVEEKALAVAQQELAATGATVIAVPTDVTKAEEVDALARRAVDAFDGLHVVCNNAGVATGGLSWQMSLGDWQWVLGVNLWGVIHGIRSFVPLMIERGEAGHVVNTASLAGHLSAPGMAAYSASKFAVVTISESLCQELAMTGAPIKVSVLCPGFVATRIGEAERNRPPELAPDDMPQEMGVLREAFNQLLSAGIDPAVVAGHVLDAIRNEQFYVFTHPELSAQIQARMEAVIEGRSPAFTAFV
jgi:NAD(P)-dependent dehydrogenase (short-subunit alcohol dehydrogenase family)